jgi:hypothetical protein
MVWFLGTNYMTLMTEEEQAKFEKVRGLFSNCDVDTVHR